MIDYDRYDRVRALHWQDDALSLLDQRRPIAEDEADVIPARAIVHADLAADRGIDVLVGADEEGWPGILDLDHGSPIAIHGPGTAWRPMASMAMTCSSR